LQAKVFALALSGMSNPSRRNIIPSSGAIHTSNDEKGRTFYYSSLIIDHGPKSSSSRWKVYLGDIVAVAKSNPKKSTQEVIESWKPNHYARKSPDWKIGLVIALRKVITRHGGGAGGINFECHVQWLEKSLDLDKEEMKSANLKSVYRPYNTNSSVTGSQLPHVLINCPGDYGIVSMVSTLQASDELNIILPVNITMKTNRDFMRNGVKEADESRHELQFCCTKTRRHLRQQRKGDGSNSLPAGRSILNEREPDAWVHLNRPGANENNNNDNNGQSLINKIPGPLQQAWKGWLQTESAIGSNPGNSADTTDQSTLLGDALSRGWSQNRRERYNKFILLREEQRRKKLEEEERMDQDLPSVQGPSTTKARARAAPKKVTEKRAKTSKTLKSHLSTTKLASTVKRKSNSISRSDSTAIQEECPNVKRKKKELRFSADTKQPSSQSKSKSTKVSVNLSQSNERSRGDASSRQQRVTSSRIASENSKTSLEKIDSSQRPQRKRGRQTKTEGAADDEAASTTTRDTHSTDTTLPTRGAGRKLKSKQTPKIGRSSNKHSANGSGSNVKGTKKSVSTKNTLSAILDTNEDVSDEDDVSPHLPNALRKWQIDSAFSKEMKSFHSKNGKSSFRELRMTIPLRDPTIRDLLDEDELEMLDQYHRDNCDIKHHLFHLKIGSVVAVHYKESISTTDSWSPFLVPYGVAQVMNIFKDESIDSGDGSWRLTIKWFYRHPELQNGRRSKTVEPMNKIDGLVETYESCDCSVNEILPAYIDLTSDTDEFVRCPRQEQGNDGFPIVRMLCQHLECSRGRFRRQTDWNYNYRTFLKSFLMNSEKNLPGPFQRAVEKLPPSLKKSHRTWFEDLSHQRETKSHGSEESLSDLPQLDIAPELNRTPYDYNGTQYFDSICLNLQKMQLHTTLRSKASNRWTIAVGFIIPVYAQRARLGKNSNSGGWYPFQKKWCPAQIVALYKNECGRWMMEIRWFDRFDEILQQHKESLPHMNRPHIIFETEVYDHVPVTAALPGRVILSSVENKENWNAIISDATGLPLIPRVCNHICLDEEIDTCTDWSNYDLNISQIPPCLSRGLLSRPRNRKSKKLLSTLSRYYIKMISKRGPDTDHCCLKKWSSEKSHLVQIKKSFCQRFVPGGSTVDLGPHLLAVNQERKTLDFFKSVTIHSLNEYLVSPSMDMKRRKENLFECAIGDIVCYFDEHAGNTASYTSTQHSKNPWYPFEIPWSYGQILAIYKGSKEEHVNVELRRFYRLSELSDEASRFLPLHLEGNREEIFESNDVTKALDADRLLGTADVFLGNHKTSGNDNVSRESQRFIISCRCKFFYLKSFQRLQPIFWSSLLPAGWQQGLQQRGYQQSSFVNKYEKLQQLLKKNLDRGLICEMLISNEDTEKEGSCIRLGKAIKSSASQYSFYAEASLHPQWSLFCASDYFSLAESSDRKSWTLKIGDIVAVKDFETSQSDDSYPFSFPWYPGQVIAVFNEANSNELNSVNFEIRRLQFEISDNIQRRLVTTCESSTTTTINSKSLLGPVVLYSPETNVETDLSVTQTHLPLSEFMAAVSLKIDIESALQLSKLYKADDKVKIRQLAQTEVINIQAPKSSSLHSDSSSRHERNRGKLQPATQPFRVDESSLRAFYRDVTVMPQCKISRGGTYEVNSAPVTIKIGDTIRARFEGPKRFPYDCNWSIVEVVAIFEDFSSKEDLDQKSRERPSADRQESFKIEIRWFYDRHEISGSISLAKDESELTEVFETDHCQILIASNAILDHIQLVENASDVTGDITQCFLCTRFWSTKRRSLIPCNGLKGRIKRGMMYSTLGSEHDLNGSSSSKTDSIPPSNIPGNWKESMANLICKLTLKDASRNAYTKGDALVGREKEMSQILAFLRGAFFEDRKSAGYKSSMFLAGPPGVVRQI